MVAPPPGDDDLAAGLAAREVVGARHLERRLDRLRAARHRVDGRVVERQDRADLGGVRLERLARERGAVRVGDAAACVRHHGRDLAPPVADVDDDRAAGGVEVRPPVGVADGRALGPHRDRQVAPEDAGKDPAAQNGSSARLYAWGRSWLGRPPATSPRAAVNPSPESGLATRRARRGPSGRSASTSC